MGTDNGLDIHASARARALTGSDRPPRPKVCLIPPNRFVPEICTRVQETVSEKLLGIGQARVNGHEMRRSPTKRYTKAACHPADGCAFGDCLQHRLHVVRRTGDDLQYLGRRRLLLAGFLQVLARTGYRTTPGSGGRRRNAGAWSWWSCGPLRGLRCGLSPRSSCRPFLMAASYPPPGQETYLIGLNRPSGRGGLG